MRLESWNGAVVGLQPISYQFSADTVENDWDANWLVINGDVLLPDGRSWSFTEPCLTTWEARELASWFRDALAGHVEPSPVDGGDESLFVFTEPNVALSLASRDEHLMTVRIHLSLESAPPWTIGRDHAGLLGYFVEVGLPPAGWTRALAQWTVEIQDFPVR